MVPAVVPPNENDGLVIFDCCKAVNPVFALDAGVAFEERLNEARGFADCSDLLSELVAAVEKSGTPKSEFDGRV